jgi:signal transduction histidine kinase
MEAIGTLAGGIAHDFNNILTTIIGYGHLLQKKINKEDATKQYLDQILSTSERASALVQGLLTFSRKQLTTPQTVKSQ